MQSREDKALARLQGEPVGNWQDELIKNIRDLQQSSSSDAPWFSSLKSFFRISHSPLMRVYLKNKSADSTDGKEKQRKVNRFSSILRRKAPVPIANRTLTYKRDQSSSADTPILSLPSPRVSNSESFISVYWKLWFHREKRQRRERATKQEIIAGNEAKEVQEPETQLAPNLEEPPLGKSQRQQQSIDPEPERLKPKRPSTVSEEHILSTFEPDHLPLTAEPEDAEPNQPASLEANLPINPKPECLETKTSKKSDHLPVAAELKTVDLPIDTESEHLEPKTLKKVARNESEEYILCTIEPEYLPLTAEPEDAESNQSADPEPEHLKPKTPKKRLTRNVSEEHILSIFQPDQPSVETEPKNVKPEQPASGQSISNNHCQINF